MSNTISFSQLQHLYRVFELTDARDPSAIRKFAPTFQKLNEILVVLEAEQGKLRDSMNPLFREYQEATKEGGTPGDELKAKLDKANEEVVAFQSSVPEIEWTAEDAEVIKNAIQYVLQTHGTAHPSLKGYESLMVLHAFILQFDIQDAMIGQ